IVACGQHGYEIVVFGGGADHGGAADVDVFNTQGEISATGDGFGEGIQVDDKDIDILDTAFLHGGQVCDIIAAGQQAAMHGRVQGFDAAVHDFREGGYVGYVAYGDACILYGLEGAAG